MSNHSSSAKSSTPASLLQYADDNSGYIRHTMQSSISFTGISGKGYSLAGIPALAAVLGLTMTTFKAGLQGSSLWSPDGNRVLLAFLPGVTVGGIFMLAFYVQDDVALVPCIWKRLHGAAVMTAGMHSISIIPVTEALLIMQGALVLFTPLPANTTLGLGILHIIFGILVWRNHGGY